MLNGILNRMGEIIHGINTPPVPGVVMGHVGHTVDDRIPHVDVGGSHVNLGAQDLFPILVPAVLHLLKQLQVLFNAPVPVWAFLTGSGKVASVLPDLLRGQVTDKCLSFLNQEYGALIHLFEIIGGKKQPVLKISAQPLHIRHNGFHEFRLLFCGVCIVKTQVELSTVLLCQTVVE